MKYIPGPVSWSHGSETGHRCRLERNKEAMEALKEAVDYGFNDLNVLCNEPDLDPLGALPEFRELIDRVKERIEERGRL